MGHGVGVRVGVGGAPVRFYLRHGGSCGIAIECKVLLGLYGVVPSWLVGTAINSALPRYCLKTASKGGYLSVFEAISLSSRPKSRQTPIFTRGHCLRSGVVESRGGVAGKLLAHMRSGTFPCSFLMSNKEPGPGVPKGVCSRGPQHTRCLRR